MSTLDELFPESDRPDPEPSPATPSRALGLAALVIVAVAIIGDLVTASAVIGTLSATGNVDDRLTPLIAALFATIIVVAVGAGFAAVGLILGIVAAVRRRGRRLGILAAVLGALVVTAHIVFAVSAESAVSSLS